MRHLRKYVSVKYGLAAVNIFGEDMFRVHQRVNRYYLQITTGSEFCVNWVGYNCEAAFLECGIEHWIEPGICELYDGDNILDIEDFYAGIPYTTHLFSVIRYGVCKICPSDFDIHLREEEEFLDTLLE